MVCSGELPFLLEGRTSFELKKVFVFYSLKFKKKQGGTLVFFRKKILLDEILSHVSKKVDWKESDEDELEFPLLIFVPLCATFGMDCFQFSDGRGCGFAVFLDQCI